MGEYYKDELMSLIELWPDDRIDFYIKELEERILSTKEHISTLRALKKRRGRNKNLKESGVRGGL